MTEKRSKRRTPPTNITMPASVSQNILEFFVEPFENAEFFSRPSKSMVIRALCEIAIEKADRFDPGKASDYESLKAELRRMLANSTEG